MKLSLDQLRFIQKKEDKFNPFSNEFDIAMLQATINQYEDYDEAAEGTIKYILIAHETYKTLSEEVYIIFDELKLNAVELTTLIFKFFNRMLIQKKAINEREPPQTDTSFDFTTKDNVSIIENEQRGSANIDSSIKYSTDLLSVILELILKWSPSTSTNYAHLERGDQLFTTYMSNIIEVALPLLSLKEIYNKYLFDNYHIMWKSEWVIKVVPEHIELELIRRTAAIRYSNQLLSQLYKRSTEERKITKSLKHTTADNGLIKINQTETKESVRSILADETMKNYYSHLIELPLSNFDNLTLKHLSKIFISLMEIAESIVSDENVSKSINNIPAYYIEADLIQYLANFHGHPKATVKKFIATLTSSPQLLHFWNRPFYKIGNKLFFHLNTLTSPDLCLFFDYWLRKGGLDESNIRNIFKSYIIQVLSKKATFKFKPLHLETLSTSDIDFSTNLAFELTSCLLLIEIFTFPRSLDEEEHEEILRNMFIMAKLVERKGEILKSVKSKNVISCIITNNLMYSGLNINEISVSDIFLIDDYIYSGAYSKLVVSTIGDELFSKPLSTIRYYKSEKEFAGNLKAFLELPVPIKVILENLTCIEQDITPQNFPIEITIDAVRMPENDKLHQESADTISESLYYSHFLYSDDNKEGIHNEIQFRLADIFYKMAISNYADSSQHEQLLDAMMGSGKIGMTHLNFYLRHSLKNTPWVLTNKEIFELPSALEENEELIQRIQNHLDHEIHLPTVLIPDIFTHEEGKMLISYAFILINNAGYQQLDGKDIKLLLFCLAILYGFRDRHPTIEHFYKASDTTISLLNHSHMYGKAKSLTKDILQIATSLNQHAYAWNALFNCYTMQHNAYKAAMYGCLFFTSLITGGEVSHDLMVTGYSNFLKYLRNFNFHEEAVQFLEWSKQLDLNEFDRHKMACIYLDTLLKNVYKHPEGFNEVVSYFDKHLDYIANSKSHSIGPWLFILYTLIWCNNLGIYNVDEKIHNYIRLLEEKCSEEELTSVRYKAFGAQEHSKSIFIENMLNALEIRNLQDRTFEASHLTYLANHLIRYSMKTGDLEGILLSGLVLNDSTFSYLHEKLEEGDTIHSETRDDIASKFHLHHYKEYVLSSLRLKNEQILLWFLKIDRHIICLLINSNKVTNIFTLAEWNMQILSKWTSDIGNFFFNSKKLREYDLTLQEKEHSRMIDLFLFTSLDAIPLTKYNELIICFSTDLVQMPHNLLVSGKQFLEERYAVCNVLSIENFINHHRIIELPHDYTTAAWIPTDDGNATVSWGYSQLELILKKRGADIQTSHYPYAPLNADVNIFLAHGIREYNGFEAVRTTNHKESIIVNPLKVFGKGQIAILFICNSGSTMQQQYGRQIVSFCGDLLKIGYHAVIAPYWPYDVTMSGKWLEAFLGCLDDGFTINESVYHANRRLATYDETTSQIFFAPQGSLAMHLYGNPNIVVKVV